MRDPPLILIVDDNADNREILEARLASQGYQTALAIDGEEALQAVRALLPDLVLLDVMMPKLDGFEVTRKFGPIPPCRTYRSSWSRRKPRRRTSCMAWTSAPTSI